MVGLEEQLLTKKFKPIDVHERSLLQVVGTWRALRILWVHQGSNHLLLLFEFLSNFARVQRRTESCCHMDEYSIGLEGGTESGWPSPVLLQTRGKCITQLTDQTAERTKDSLLTLEIGIDLPFCHTSVNLSSPFSS